MVPRWLPGSKKDAFWVTLECPFEVVRNVSSMIFTYNARFFLHDCGDFRWYLLIKDCKYYSFALFLCVFAFVYPCSVEVVEAAPPGAAEDHWNC